MLVLRKFLWWGISHDFCTYNNVKPTLASYFLDRVELLRPAPNDCIHIYIIKTAAKMLVNVTFNTPIGGEYKRNNRSTRQKSLRCFPSCGIKGHVPGGFCGLPLRVTIEVARENNEVDFDPKMYFFIAEIRPATQPRISAMASISEADLLRQIRTKEKTDTNGELFQADSNINVVSQSGDISTVELTFNSQHCSWDYAWKSNRWSGPQEHHVVDIIILRYSATSEHRVVSSKESSPFVVSSSHKKPQKATQVKQENEDEIICLPASTKSKSVPRAVVRTEEGDDELIKFAPPYTSSSLLSRRHAAAPHTHELKASEDGTELNLVRLSESNDLQEGVEGLLLMMGKKEGHSVAASAAVVPVSRKEKKVSASPEKKSQKRIKTGESFASFHMQLPLPLLPLPSYPEYQEYLKANHASSTASLSGSMSGAGNGYPPFYPSLPYPQGMNYAHMAHTQYMPPHPKLSNNMHPNPQMHYMICPPGPPHDPYYGYDFQFPGRIPSLNEEIEWPQAEGEDGREEERGVRPVAEAVPVVGGDSDDGSPMAKARPGLGLGQRSTSVQAQVPVAKLVPIAVTAVPKGERRTFKSGKRTQSLGSAGSSGPSGSGSVPHTTWNGQFSEAPSAPLVPLPASSVDTVLAEISVTPSVSRLLGGVAHMTRTCSDVE